MRARRKRARVKPLERPESWRANALLAALFVLVGIWSLMFVALVLFLPDGHGQDHGSGDDARRGTALLTKTQLAATRPRVLGNLGSSASSHNSSSVPNVRKHKTQMLLEKAAEKHQAQEPARANPVLPPATHIVARARSTVALSEEIDQSEQQNMATTSHQQLPVLQLPRSPPPPPPPPLATPTPHPNQLAESQPEWTPFPNVWLPTYYLMGYANPEAREHNDLEKVKEACIKLGCVAVTVEQNGWLEYFRNVPSDKSTWLPKPKSTMWVLTKYLSVDAQQPDMKYGCSRHAHACRHHPEPGTAPCCAMVMLEIMLDMSRVLRQHGIHWRITQGQQLSVARDGFLQLWDHDFDPLYEAGKEPQAKRLINDLMHLAGKPTKYREADYFYTKRVAERQKTNWSRYKVMGGDFNWNHKVFHEPYTLQRDPTFMDIGQNQKWCTVCQLPTQLNTFPCWPGKDILCSKQWHEEVLFEAKGWWHSQYLEPPKDMPQRQIPYSGYKSLRQLPNLMFEENGSERDEQSRAAIIGEYTSKCPDFWDKPCATVP